MQSLQIISPRLWCWHCWHCWCQGGKTNEKSRSSIAQWGWVWTTSWRLGRDQRVIAWWLGWSWKRKIYRLVVQDMANLMIIWVDGFHFDHFDNILLLVCASVLSFVYWLSSSIFILRIVRDKGYGLGLMVEIFCGILSGSAWGPSVRKWKIQDQVFDLHRQNRLQQWTEYYVHYHHRRKPKPLI